MVSKQPIPVLSTNELWQRYVGPVPSLRQVFGSRPDEFLVTRLEESYHLLSLPTKPHRREVNEVVFVTSGKVRRSADLQQIDIGPGDIHVAFANQVLTVDLFSTGLAGYYCHFNEKALTNSAASGIAGEMAALSHVMRQGPVRLNGLALSSVKTIFERLIAAPGSPAEHQGLVSAYLVALLYEIGTVTANRKQEEDSAKGLGLVRRFRQLAAASLHRHKSICFYAGQLHVTPNHLNKMVKQATGKHAKALVADLLILEARTLLHHSELSVSEIAFQLGFPDQSYFSRFFKSSTGTSPREYRLLK